MNKTLIFTFIMFTHFFCSAQKNTPVDYIEAGTKLLEIFTKSSDKNIDDCIFEVKFDNKSSEKITIFIEERDSLINRAVIPPNSSSSLYSLLRGTYKCKIKNESNEILKESEILIDECGKLELKIE